MDFLKLMRPAMAHFAAGRYAEAESLLRKAHLADRTHADPLHFLGLLAATQGRMDDAIALIERAFERSPADAIHRRNFVVVLAKSEREADRQRAFVEAEAALALAPGDPAMVQVFAEAAGVSGRPLRAADAWQWIARHARPDDPVVHFNIGTSFQTGGELRRALEAYEAAVRLRPDYFEAQANLASLLARMGRPADAVAILRRLHGQRPDVGDVATELAALLVEGGAVGEGEALLESVVASGHYGRRSLGHLGRALTATGRVAEALDAFARQAALDSSEAASYSAFLLTAQYAFPDEPARQLAIHRRFERDYCAAVPQMFTVAPREGGGRTVRVGFVSSDFRNHSVGYFFEPLLAALDGRRVEPHCFDVAVTKPDDLTARLRAAAPRWHECAFVDDAALAARVREAGIDVLIDLNGHTGETRLRMFARRPAPLQLTYLGYPNTTGMTSIDGRVTDAVADPPGSTEAFHAERLLRMPHTFALFKPADEAPPVAPTPARANGLPTLACVAAIVKANPAVIDAWADILRRLPPARLMLVGGGYGDGVVQARVAADFRRRGVDPSRLEFVGHQPFAAYLALHGRFDLVLDTFPFNGHTTTVQNLWQGVPVVTLAGVSHRNRMGASVLTCIGLRELIAGDVEEYVARAVGLASDVDRLAGLRSGMRDRMSASPLMDAPRFAKDFEDLLLAAHAGGASRA